MKWKLFVLGILIGSALVYAVMIQAATCKTPPTEVRSTEDEAQFLSLINNTRSSQGLPPLQLDGELTRLARRWSSDMAIAGQISHSSPISQGITQDWLRVGENVGRGPSVEGIMNAFLDSASHYANVVDLGFTHVGIGVVWDGDILYTTHKFMELSPPSTTLPPPSSTTTTTTTTTITTTIPTTQPPSTTTTQVCGR